MHTRTTVGNLLSTILAPVTTAKTTQQTQQTKTTQQQQTETTQAPQTTAKETTSDNNQTTDNPAQQTTTPTNKATQPTTTTAPSTTNNRSSSTLSTAPKGSTTTTVVTPPPATTDGSAETTFPSLTSSSQTSRPTGSNGSFSGIKASQVGMAVGIVAGIAGGFALIVFGIFFWRRHKRRQQMERLGSMEELHRAPSPPLLSRSLTRGAQGPRQPIDDDDDFLTPMDTLPNTHRMDDMNHEHNDYGDDKSMYDNDEYYENDAQQLNPAFPVPPPAAVVPANGRFYSGDPALVRPGTANSSNNSSGTIPTYSAMSKYTAYSPGAGGAATSPPAANPFSSGASTRTSSYSNPNSFSRPGAYRNYGDTHQQPYS